MKKIEKLEVLFHDRNVGILALTPDKRFCTFEYSKEWLLEGFSISPLELPLKEGVFVAKPTPFNGNFGIFEDSMPDGYGRYLLHKALLREGIDDSSLSALDRPSLVGESGMGALSYRPSTSLVTPQELSYSTSLLISTDSQTNVTSTSNPKRRDTDKEFSGFDILQKKALEVLREQQDRDAGLLLYNSGNSGGARPKAIFSDSEGHWLVKFRHTYDSNTIGKEEYQCNELARKCGIDIPDIRLINGRYFASRRFDISPNGERLHTATAGALLGVSHTTPILDYTNLLALTGYITQNEKDVEEMFRRMVFNYRIDNKDDHSKNFSFVVSPGAKGRWKWRLAPAYDLTPFPDGYNGEHATSVNGKGNPTTADFIAAGLKIKLTAKRCLEIIHQIDSLLSRAK